MDMQMEVERVLNPILPLQPTKSFDQNLTQDKLGSVPQSQRTSPTEQTDLRYKDDVKMAPHRPPVTEIRRESRSMPQMWRRRDSGPPFSVQRQQAMRNAVHPQI